jgi:hypothetical protein
MSSLQRSCLGCLTVLVLVVDDRTARSVWRFPVPGAAIGFTGSSGASIDASDATKDAVNAPPFRRPRVRLGSRLPWVSVQLIGPRFGSAGHSWITWFPLHLNQFPQSVDYTGLPSLVQTCNMTYFRR